MRYSHTQFGWLNLILLTGATTYGLIMFGVLSGPFKLIPLGIAVLMLFLLIFFYALRIEVDTDSIHMTLGIGWYKRKWALSEIVSARAIKTRFIDGWGIKLTKHGWLYSVSMPDAVLLELDSGKNVLLGTDDSDALLAALAESGINVHSE